MKKLLTPILLVAAFAAVPALAEQTVTATGGTIRVLDKLTGKLTDLELSSGQTQSLGHLSVTLVECRYPQDNPAGNAYAELKVHYRESIEPVFSGWMIASSPAVSAMEHPRYDVWPLHCRTS